MSEYQYYEFQAVDRPLTTGEQDALRNLSSRARITATTFVNSYEWGDFKGDPSALMKQMFDLHLYLANWGSRRLMMRFPAHSIDRMRLAPCLAESDDVSLEESGGNLILDINRGELESGDWVTGEGELSALAPLRGQVMQGDLRLFYLIWLTAVENELIAVDAPEPLPGLGPLTGALEAFAEFFMIDADLVAAAAERDYDPFPATAGPQALQELIAAMSSAEQSEALLRAANADPLLASELRRKARARLEAKADALAIAPRTVAELCARAEAIGMAREAAAAQKAAGEQRKRTEIDALARKQRLAALAKRGEGAWREVDNQIDYRTAKGYDQAYSLLRDLHDLAAGNGSLPDYRRRLNAIRINHATKRSFIARIADLG